MGEITDALKRANKSGDGFRAGVPMSRQSRGSSGEVSEAMRRANASPASEVEVPREVEVPYEVEVPHEVELKEADYEADWSGRDSEVEQIPGEDSMVIVEYESDAIFHLEHHRNLGLRLQIALDRSSSPSLAVVSAVRKEGKSTVSCNIAASLASLYSERSVALVDLDLRRPSIAQMLQVEVPVGVEQVLQGQAALGETCISLVEPEIDLYACAKPHRKAHELLELPALESFIRDLEERYSVVIIDTPPSLLAPDATLIMRSAGFCIAVARAGVTRVHRFTEMLDLLPAEKFLGKVLNNVPLPSHSPDNDYYADAYANGDTR